MQLEYFPSVNGWVERGGIGGYGHAALIRASVTSALDPGGRAYYPQSSLAVTLLRVEDADPCSAPGHGRRSQENELMSLALRSGLVGITTFPASLSRKFGRA